MASILIGARGTGRGLVAAVTTVYILNFGFEERVVGGKPPVREHAGSAEHRQVTGSNEQWDQVLAGGGVTATISLVPVAPQGITGSYPAGTIIVGSELIAPNGGFRGFFNVRIKNWDPSGNGPLLRNFMVMLSPDVLLGVNADPPNPGNDIVLAVQPCTPVSCTSAFGELGTSCQSGACQPNFVNGTRGDWLFYGLGFAYGGSDLVSAIRFFGGPGSLSPYYAADAGIDYYAGTLVLDIPGNVAGTYTLSFIDLRTFLVDQVGNYIPILAMIPGAIKVQAPACSGPNCGACCVRGEQCRITGRAACEDPPPSGVGGVYLGDGVPCARQTVVLVPEGNGTVFRHYITVPVDCGFARAASRPEACPPLGPYYDAWVSPNTSEMVHDFGSAETQPIPADFFGPGSDVYTGTVRLHGAPLGLPQYGNADTLIERTSDPFGRCVLPSATPSTINVEIVALSLVSVEPVTVTYNGGQTSEQWNVFVDLSPGGVGPGTPPSSLTATKSTCNGGTYISTLYVQPRFTFTGPRGTRVLDTLIAGMPTVTLDQVDPLPWVGAIDPNLNVTLDQCTSFHPGIAETPSAAPCDCNNNLRSDRCDIEDGLSADCNRNLVPDDCDIARGTSPDTAPANGVPDECDAAPPLLADPSDLNKPRFISFSIPPTGGPNGETALRVRPVWFHHVDPPYTGGVSIPFSLLEGTSLYVGPPMQYVESASSGASFYASLLQCAPYYQDWSTVGLLHVTGEAIVPSSVYQVQNLAASCAGNEAICAAVSAPLEIKTARWGDVEMPYQDPIGPLVTQPDTSDISALVNKFKSALGAPIKARALLAGSTTRGTFTHDDIAADVGFAHISQCVDAFKGLPYPYKPGKCTGDALKACITNADCTMQSTTGPCILCP